MNITRVLYLSDTTLSEHQAKVTAVHANDNGTTTVVLDASAIFPQGGGQRSDTGTITTRAGDVLRIDGAKLIDGIMYHNVSLPDHVPLNVGEPVRVQVDIEQRILHTRLHTAGELICAVVQSMGLDWPVLTANHFPGAAKVTFNTGAGLPDGNKAAFEKRLELELDRAIRANARVTILVTEDRGLMVDLVGFDPDYLPAGGQYRVVRIGNDFARPCMGTHVSGLAEIGSISLRSFRWKRDSLSIGYDITDKLPKATFATTYVQ